MDSRAPHVAIIGGGFCGLAAGYELSQRGIGVTIVEQEAEVGGLAGSFRVGGARLEKFYHHWFMSDEHVMALVQELGTPQNIIRRAARTGMYYANDLFRLSNPIDVLRFKPLPLIDRLRLALLAVRAQHSKDWHELEKLTAAEWLCQMGGDRVYEVVWEPLLRGKFGEYAPQISAAWIWNKLKLRGGSRDRGGGQRLAYYRGGFAALADQLVASIETKGGRVLVNTRVEALDVEASRIVGLHTGCEHLSAHRVIATPALQVVADLITPHVGAEYVATLRRIKYLANVCIVLGLDRSLSDTYWVNVNDPGFPFVGVIEHTNFEAPASYAGLHVVYLSRYLPETDWAYRATADELLALVIPALQRMFPAFHRDWIQSFDVWRAPYAQPVVERGYQDLIPPSETPLSGLFLCSMAQIYPEDRGTNYAIRQGREIARRIAADLQTSGVNS